jgi:hypothetical protein
LLQRSGTVPEAMRRDGGSRTQITPLSPTTTRDHDIRGGPVFGGPDTEDCNRSAVAMACPALWRNSPLLREFSCASAAKCAASKVTTLLAC